MKIKINAGNGRSIWHKGRSIVHGQEVEVSDRDGEHLISKGLALESAEFDALDVNTALQQAGQDGEPASTDDAATGDSSDATGEASATSSPEVSEPSKKKAGKKAKDDADQGQPATPSVNIPEDLSTLTYDEKSALAKALGIDPISVPDEELNAAIEAKRGA